MSNFLANLIASVNKKLKVPANLGKLLIITPGGRHAWFESNVGPVRKQYPLNV